jgi:hypothetical protein
MHRSERMLRWFVHQRVLRAKHLQTSRCTLFWQRRLLRQIHATTTSADRRVKTMGSSVRTLAIVARTRAPAAFAERRRCVCRMAADVSIQSNVVRVSVLAASATLRCVASMDPSATSPMIAARTNARAAFAAAAFASLTERAASTMRNVAPSSAIRSRTRAASTCANPTARSARNPSSVAAGNCDFATNSCGFGGCFPDGFSCEADFQCCNGFCDPNTFSCGFTCQPDGVFCINDFDCCAGVCDPLTNSCGLGSCFPNNFPCNTNGECCSGACQFGSCFNPMCLPDGLPCNSGFECCNGFCDPNTFTCGFPQCFPDGSMCGSPMDCCSGQCNGGICGGPTCQLDGLPCNGDMDCCNGVCQNNICGTGMCLPPGSTCTTNQQCCMGLVCNGGFCGMPPGQTPPPWVSPRPTRATRP